MKYVYRFGEKFIIYYEADEEPWICGCSVQIPPLEIELLYGKCECKKKVLKSRILPVGGKALGFLWVDKWGGNDGQKPMSEIEARSMSITSALQM